MPRPRDRLLGRTNREYVSGPFSPGYQPPLPELPVDLVRRQQQLLARVTELQWDLGGLAYEMVIRDQVRVELLAERVAQLQEADAELAEVERIMRLEQTGVAGDCGVCGAPHSSGATYCWQCGSALLAQLPSTAIAAR